MPVSRSNERQTSFLGKIVAYRVLIARELHKTHLGVSKLLVLTLTTSQARMAEIMARMTEHPEGDTAAFLFKAMEAQSLARPASELLTDPWQRAGLSPLQIDR